MQVDFFIHTTDGMIRFNNHEIFYIQANGTGSKIVTSRGEYLVRTPIGKLDLECLPSEAFCRVDKSFIVSLENVRAFKLDEVVINRTRIPVAKHYRSRLFLSVNVIW